jgi:hypothetical protein
MHRRPGTEVPLVQPIRCFTCSPIPNHAAKAEQSCGATSARARFQVPVKSNRNLGKSRISAASSASAPAIWPDTRKAPLLYRGRHFALVNTRTIASRGRPPQPVFAPAGQVSGARQTRNVPMRFRWSRTGTHRDSDPRTAAGALLRCRDERSKLTHQPRQSPLRKHPANVSNRVP